MCLGVMNADDIGATARRAAAAVAEVRELFTMVIVYIAGGYSTIISLCLSRSASK